MKEYIKPEMEVEEFEFEDIITGSDETPMNEVVGNGDSAVTGTGEPLF